MNKPKRTPAGEKSGIEIALGAAEGMAEFSYVTLALETGQLEITVQDYIRRLANSRKIKQIRKDGRTNVYMTAARHAEWASKAPSADGPPSPEGNMWRTMRHLRVFDAVDLSSHSTAGGVDVTEKASQLYCKRLMQAGYLRVVSKAIPGLRNAKYRLIDDTGPLAPRVKRMRVVVDGNRHEHKIIGAASQ